jgi:hypothetical protein
MNFSVVPKDRANANRVANHAVRMLVILMFSSLAAVAQNAAQAGNTATPFRVRATHLLGFEGTKNTCNGTLSLQDDSLQFQQNGKPAAKISIDSVRNIFLGGESKQVGGLPMTLGKAAVPFGGGRAVSLFSHKKYDSVTLEYVDSDAGIHGAIFQINKGQGEALKTQLAARGVAASPAGEGPTKQSAAEATNANK